MMWKLICIFRRRPWNSIGRHLFNEGKMRDNSTLKVKHYFWINHFSWLRFIFVLLAASFELVKTHSFLSLVSPFNRLFVLIAKVLSPFQTLQRNFFPGGPHWRKLPPDKNYHSKIVTSTEKRKKCDKRRSRRRQKVEKVWLCWTLIRICDTVGSISNGLKQILKNG